MYTLSNIDYLYVAMLISTEGYSTPPEAINAMFRDLGFTSMPFFLPEVIKDLVINAKLYPEVCIECNTLFTFV